MITSSVRAECNYKIGIERKIREELSEWVQRLISSVTFYASMKHYILLLLDKCW